MRRVHRARRVVGEPVELAVGIVAVGAVGVDRQHGARGEGDRHADVGGRAVDLGDGDRIAVGVGVGARSRYWRTGCRCRSRSPAWRPRRAGRPARRRLRGDGDRARIDILLAGAVAGEARIAAVSAPSLVVTVEGVVAVEVGVGRVGQAVARREGGVDLVQGRGDGDRVGVRAPLIVAGERFRRRRRSSMSSVP